MLQRVLARGQLLSAALQQSAGRPKHDAVLELFAHPDRSSQTPAKLTAKFFDNQAVEQVRPGCAEQRRRLPIKTQICVLIFRPAVAALRGAGVAARSPPAVAASTRTALWKKAQPPMCLRSSGQVSRGVIKQIVGEQSQAHPVEIECLLAGVRWRRTATRRGRCIIAVVLAAAAAAGGSIAVDVPFRKEPLGAVKFL